jgi:hypothetical protein
MLPAAWLLIKALFSKRPVFVPKAQRPLADASVASQPQSVAR